MLTSNEASTLAIMIPITGIPFLETILKLGGNNLSLAAAKGICPCSRIHPFKAPKHEIEAPIAIRPEAQFPQINCAASAKGAAEFCSSAGAMIPMIPTELDI